MAIAAAIIGLVSLIMMSMTLLLPWYELDKYWNSGFMHHDEYGLIDFTRDGSNMSYDSAPFFRITRSVLGMGAVGDFMAEVELIVMVSLAASSVALVLTILNLRRPGVGAGIIAAAIMFFSGCYFYFGVVDVLDLDGFTGLTNLNRSYAADAGPLLGYMITIIAPIVQSAQAIVLAYSGD